MPSFQVKAISGRTLEIHHSQDHGLVVNGHHTAICNLEAGDGILHVVTGIALPKVPYWHARLTNQHSCKQHVSSSPRHA